MPFGYVIGQVSVTDPEGYAKYPPMASKSVAAFGGEYIVRGGTSEVVEGDPVGNRIVIIRFPSYEKALAWYNSEAYGEAKPLRAEASKMTMTIVEGIE